MIQTIKKWLYDVITSYSIIFHLLNIPIIRQFILRFVYHPNKIPHKITDAGGDSMNVSKYNGKFFPAAAMGIIAGIKDTKIRHDDVILCGYPKTGCHWMHEILHMLVTGKPEMTKFGKTLGGMIDVMHPFIVDSLPSPRILNTHILYEDLPAGIKENKCKIIWTVRSPKDTVVSFYNHTQALATVYEYKGSFDNYFKLFMEGKVEYGSYFDYVLAWEEAMNNQTNNSILVVEYETLKKDTLPIVKRIAQFLDISLSDEQAQKVVEETRFKKMKEKRQGMSKLFRKGQVGDWKNWLSDDQSRQIEQVWKERMSDCNYKPNMAA